jgi:hypothetical protein
MPYEKFDAISSVQEGNTAFRQIRSGVGLRVMCRFRWSLACRFRIGRCIQGRHRITTQPLLTRNFTLKITMD